MILIFDTETTGLPIPNAPITKQPYLVQLGCIVLNHKLMPCRSFSSLVKPDGWIIPDQATEIHGISTQNCIDYGLPLKAVINEFLCLQSLCQHRVAHSAGFDTQILNFSLQRVEDHYPLPIETHCTMAHMTAVCKLRGWKEGQYKWPSLAEAYNYATRRNLSGAHSAIVDCLACRDILQYLNDNKILELR